MTSQAKGEAVQIGEDAVSIRVPNAATADVIARRLRTDPALEDAVAGLDSVVVRFDPCRLDAEDAAARLVGARVATGEVAWADTRVVDIPIRYGGEDGPDLPDLAARAGLPVKAWISCHLNAVYRVEMLGFLPGFAYLSGLNPKLNTARLATPRARVPAGSIGVSGRFCGAYPLASPGGWPIIGRTDISLFRPQADDPFWLRPGDQVRFRKVAC